MHILFTGGSSFTGYWFIKELASQGHDVVAVFRRGAEEYTDDIRKARIAALGRFCEPVFHTAFGDDKFMDLVHRPGLDLLCCHGAEVSGYNKPGFDVTAAVASNTYHLENVLQIMEAAGCNKILLTGSVFESDEGAGSNDLRAFSAYGLSKSFTWQVFRYFAQVRGIDLGKFVIANPFGPYEERRFTHYLMKCWFDGIPATVNAPNYVRDNIHASLLAKAYVRFATAPRPGISRINPSGYVESQGAFTERFATQMRQRLGRKCEFSLKEQTEYPEPRVRINTDLTDVGASDWSEPAAWDELASYYVRHFGA